MKETPRLRILKGRDGKLGKIWVLIVKRSECIVYVHALLRRILQEHDAR